jgi:1-deoxy-D-xylulose 5-phosphate reductoisomerase
MCSAWLSSAWFAPRYAVMDDEESARLLKAQLLEKGSRTEVLSGQQAACEMAALDEVDQVMAAIVGAAGFCRRLPRLMPVKMFCWPIKSRW